MSDVPSWSDEHFVGALHSIVNEAIDGSQKVFEPLLSRTQDAIKNSDSYDQARQLLGRELIDPHFIHAFGSHLYESHVAADGLGRSFIVQKDRHFSQLHRRVPAKYRYGRLFVRAEGMNWYECADHVDISFDLIPQEALNYMREKSFWISGIEDQALLDAIQEKLAAALQQGAGYKDFVQGIQDTIDSLGYSGPTPFRLETIFRTNLYGAYSMGQLSQVEQVKDRFPMWRYHAIKDSRTRPMHRELDGMVFKLGEGPFPPIDFNCRCTGQFIHDLEAAGITPVSSEGAQAIMQHNNVVRFDQKAEFEKWLAQEQATMDGRIKQAVREELK